jgi:adenine deaminase
MAYSVMPLAARGMAANAVIDADGGMAVASGGMIRALLPVCGLLSDAPTEEVAAGSVR